MLTLGPGSNERSKPSEPFTVSKSKEYKAFFSLLGRRISAPSLAGSSYF